MVQAQHKDVITPTLGKNAFSSTVRLREFFANHLYAIRAAVSSYALSPTPTHVQKLPSRETTSAVVRASTATMPSPHSLQGQKQVTHPACRRCRAPPGPYIPNRGLRDWYRVIPCVSEDNPTMEDQVCRLVNKIWGTLLPNLWITQAPQLITLQRNSNISLRQSGYSSQCPASRDPVRTCPLQLSHVIFQQIDTHQARPHLLQ